MVRILPKPVDIEGLIFYRVKIVIGGFVFLSDMKYQTLREAEIATELIIKAL